MSTIEERAKKIIAEQLGACEADLKPETHLADDAGADSLDAVELVMALEDEFGIEIPDADAKGWHTVEDITNWLENVKT